LRGIAHQTCKNTHDFSSTTCAFSILITIPYFLRVKQLRKLFLYEINCKI
jgi:hypothetical protein